MKMQMSILATLAACTSLVVATGTRGPAPKTPTKTGKVCTVQAHGNQTDDTPQILAAFESCNHGGTVVFPTDQNYWIATKLNPVIHDVTIEWKGVWTVSDGSVFF